MVTPNSYLNLSKDWWMKKLMKSSKTQSLYVLKLLIIGGQYEKEDCKKFAYCYGN